MNISLIKVIINILNMKKLFFSIIAAVLFTVTAGAQVRATDLYTISGQLVDTLTNDPVPYATVSVAFAQSPAQFVNAVASDGNGRFVMQLREPGDYVMTIQSVITAPLVKTFTLSETNRSLDFGRIFLHEQSLELTEVAIVAQRPLVRVDIDKITYSVEDDPEARVNNTLDMLRKVPMVTVDGEDRILLRGASNFRIYLNGRPSNLFSGQTVSDVLKSMPANTIRTIEVITDPGARYDAEGIGGIINIVTSRNLFQGYQGSVSANAGTFGSFGGNTFLTAKMGKLGLTGNFSYNNNRRPSSNSETVTDYINNPLFSRQNTFGSQKGGGEFMFGRLEASYDIDTLRLLSLGVNIWNGKFNSISQRTIEMFNGAPEIPLYSYKTDGDNNFKYGSTGLNLDYQRSMNKKDENLTFSYRFNNSPDDNETSSRARDITGVLPPNIRLNQRYDNKARTTEHTGQVDYINPLSQRHTIETGLKYILRQNISKVDHFEMVGGSWVELLPRNVNNDFEHISHIYSAYGGYALRLPKFGVRAGVRAEGTSQNVQFRLDESRNFEVDYYNVVPSVTVSYQLKPTQQMRAGYNMRISRPSIWFLNPYVNDTDPLNISYGNPELDPEKSHNFNLNYSFFSVKLNFNINATYSFVNNSIQYYTFIHEASPEVRQNTYGNIGTNHRTGLFANAGWTPNRTLRINFNGGLNYVDLRSESEVLTASNSGLTGNVFLNAQITLPKDFRINAGGQYMTGWITLQGRQSGYYFYNVGVNKDFFERKLTVSLTCSNPFEKFLKMEMKTSNDFFITNSKSRQPMREGRISISYRFGNMTESIRRVQRSITNDDVMGGGGGSGASGGGAGGGN